MTDTTTPTADDRRDWAVCASTRQIFGSSGREAAEEWAAGHSHLSVVSRVPGGEWEPTPVAGVLAQLTDDELRAGLAELDDNRLYTILQQANDLLTERNRTEFADAVREAFPRTAAAWGA